MRGTASRTLRQALREETRDVHGALDRVLLGEAGRIVDLPHYLRLVGVLHMMHSAAEPVLGVWRADSAWAASLSPQVRLPRRAPLFATDLEALGVVPPVIGADASTEPASESRGVALLYLLAGSAAGARMLVRMIPDDVPVGARSGLADAASAEASALWRATKDLLARPAPEALVTATVTEARAELLRLVEHTERVPA